MLVFLGLVVEDIIQIFMTVTLLTSDQYNCYIIPALCLHNIYLARSAPEKRICTFTISLTFQLLPGRINSRQLISSTLTLNDYLNQ